MLNIIFAAAMGIAAVEGSVGVDLTLADGARSDLDILFTDGTRNTVTLSPMAQQSQFKWERYAVRARARHVNAKKCAKYPEALVRIDCGREPWFNFNYAILPYFDGYEGVYDHSEVLARIHEWREELPSLRETVFSFDFFYDDSVGRNAAWLNGRFAGWSSATSRIDRVNVRPSKGAKVAERPARKRTGRFLTLDAQPRKPSVNPIMRTAKLSLEPGMNDFGGVPVDVWPVEASFDTGLHRETCVRDDIFRYGMLNRSAFANGPEYLQYSVPRRAYHCAYVLCAALKESHADERPAVLATEFGSYANSRQQLATDAATLAAAPAVGSLVYTDLEGACVTTEVRLVRQQISVGQVLPEVNGKEKFLEFGFVGAGTWNELPRSNVQILGATLVASPVKMDIVERVHGNVFAAEDRKVTAVAITANEDTEVRLQYEISDERFNPLRKGEPIALKLKAGERVEREIDLDMKSPGWYQLDYLLLAADGEPLVAHEAAFTILAKDDREAGFESPYAAWPQLLGHSDDLEQKKPETKGFGGGRHGCNNDRMEVLNLLWKEGVHKGWHEVVKGETEFPERHYTFSEMGSDLKFMHVDPLTEEGLQAAFKKNGDRFEDIRRRFPHCDTVAIMHENEPRHISREVKGEKRPEVAEEKPAAIERLERYCDYMHARFPGVKLRIANNSAAAERVATLARAGFDLNKVDELGCEVRGFSTMPELAADLEAPGTMWALRETGRMFGMTNAAVGASAEYVFRPERRVLRGDPDFMDQTNYAIRDYLVSLGFGCRSISSGHAEDCASGYYDTDWGSSGHLRRWPYSYPKRMYTGFAVLTRALDCGRFTRRLTTGDNLAYALEFRRERKSPDWAYALWTPEYPVELKVRFPKGGFFSGTKVRKIDAFGREEELEIDGEGEVRMEIGATPCYLIASAAAEGARVIARRQMPVKAMAQNEIWVPKLGYSTVKCGAPSVEYAIPGEFRNEIVEGEFGQALRATLLKEGECPKVFSEYEYLEFDGLMYGQPAGPLTAYGVMVKGNGSFGRVGLVFRRHRGESDEPETNILWPGKRGYVDFTGWQMMTVHTMADMMAAVPEGYRLCGLIVGSARTVLDPLEMREVEGEVEIGGVYQLEGVMPPMRDPDFIWMQWRLRHPLAGWL